MILKEKIMEEAKQLGDYKSENKSIGEIVNDVNKKVVIRTIDLTLQEVKEEIEKLEEKSDYLSSKFNAYLRIDKIDWIKFKKNVLGEASSQEGSKQNLGVE